MNLNQKAAPGLTFSRESVYIVYVRRFFQKHLADAKGGVLYDSDHTQSPIIVSLVFLYLQRFSRRDRSSLAHVHVCTS